MAAGRQGAVLAAFLAAFLAVGCAQTPTAEPRTPHVEEFKVPPDEPRFNQPHEQGYRKPPAKKEFRPGTGGNMPGMGGPAGGMGSQG